MHKYEHVTAGCEISWITKKVWTYNKKCKLPSATEEQKTFLVLEYTIRYIK